MPEERLNGQDPKEGQLTSCGLSLVTQSSWLDCSKEWIFSLTAQSDLFALFKVDFLVTS